MSTHRGYLQLFETCMRAWDIEQRTNALIPSHITPQLYSSLMFIQQDGRPISPNRSIFLYKVDTTFSKTCLAGKIRFFANLFEELQWSWIGRLAWSSIEPPIGTS